MILPGSYQLFELVTAKWHLFYSYSKIWQTKKICPKELSCKCAQGRFSSAVLVTVYKRGTIERYAKVWMFRTKHTYHFELVERSEKISKVGNKMRKFLRNQQKKPPNPSSARKSMKRVLCHDERWLLQSDLEIQELISDRYSCKHLNEQRINYLHYSLPQHSDISSLSFPMLHFLSISSLFSSTNTGTANSHCWFTYQGIITLLALSK